MRKIFPLIGLLLAISTIAQTEAQSLQIGSIEMRFGMSKADVEKGASRMGLEKADADHWFITSGGTNPALLGSVQFSGGRVTYADREWLTKGSDPVKAILGAVNSFAKEGLRSCVISHELVPSPNATGEKAVIDCGAKRLLILKLKIDGQEVDYVTEQLGLMIPK